MKAHRLREYFEATSSSTAIAVSVSGFVPCPCVLMAGLPSGQWQQVQEIYRLARERAEAQVRSQRRRLPEFSMN